MERPAYIETDLGTEKLCTRCDEYWPADEEFFYLANKKRDGLHSWCKSCYLEWKRGRYRERKRLSVPMPVPALVQAEASAVSAHA